MSNVRLTVVVRRDLQMPVGLLAAQVAHISDGFMRIRVIKAETAKSKSAVVSLFTQEEREWMASPYLSVLAAECKEDLEAIEKDCVSAKLPVTRWVDTVPSPTFEGDVIPHALVGVAIGPADFDAIKAVTVRLSLY